MHAENPTHTENSTHTETATHNVRVANADALSLHHIHTIRQNGQQQIGNPIIQQVDLIYVQHTPVCLCKQAWLKDCATLLWGCWGCSHCVLFM